jgi:hypothetical protein
VDKEEAALVMRDVLAECAGSLLDRCVLLVPVVHRILEDYDQWEVHIACMVDDDLRRCINTVVAKHKLAIRQAGNVIILFRAKA